ncbi:methylmalonyl Co-A mutase-associated GTPase MeaB [bacterium]|nr:methylmalonyl Co-A mutase-associated GTPase MeaB [bacterium]
MYQKLINEFLMSLVKTDAAVNRRLLAKMLTLIENEVPDTKTLLDGIVGKVGHAYRIGLTGPPGAGKSTLVNAMAKSLVSQNKKIGIIAVDPSSPFTGGAILGDRYRMSEIGVHPDIFIRSMATRGSTGGLVRTSSHVADVMDAAGMDYIIFETVGVGQSEIDIVEHADTTVVVLVPESGDGVQAMKAGLMEIADVFVINKSDRAQADLIKRELEAAIELRPHDDDTWLPKVIKTIATTQEGIDGVVDQIELHLRYLGDAGRLEKRRKERIRKELIRLVDERVKDEWHRRNFASAITDHVDKIYKQTESAVTAADAIFKILLQS